MVERAAAWERARGFALAKSYACPCAAAIGVGVVILARSPLLAALSNTEDEETLRAYSP
jgi:hypothetical protein